MQIPILPALLLCVLASTLVLRAQLGTQLWATTSNIINFDHAYAVAVDASGNVIVTGYSIGSGLGTSDYYTAKYAAADGTILWEKLYNGTGNYRDIASAVTLDGSGNVVVTGSSTGSGSSGTDYYTAKYAAADGGLLWEKRYNGPGSGNDIPYAVAVDASNNVIVTGESIGSGLGNSDYYTAKYAAADGALLWEKRYNNGPGNPVDTPRAIAIDASGNVIVTGTSNNDYYTAKYATANGSLLWEKRYNGTANGPDLAYAAAVDAGGNVIVTGYSSGSGSALDCYTAKYATMDGPLLWEKRYNGTANGTDLAYAMAVDASGNVVVTGSSFGGSSGYDYYTAKYAAMDGTLLWEKRYNGPANGHDNARAVVVDENANVIVTGSSYGGSSGYDYYTAKYAAMDGTLLWEKRYKGPDDNFDAMEDFKQLALTPDGGVVVTGISSKNGHPNYATVRYSPLTLIDYAFALNPNNGSSQLPQWEVSNGTISTTFTQPPGIVSGITYGAEWTTDLAAVPWTPIPDTGTGGTHTFSVPIGPDPRKFFRFTVSQP